MNAEIAIVVSPRDWAEGLHRFVADHGGARVRARVLDGREALDEGYAVLVAEDLTSFLTPRLMAELRRQGKRVLGVYDPIEPWGRERLVELGADDTIESTAPPDRMLQAVDALAITAAVDLDAELAGLRAIPAAVERSAEPGTTGPEPPRGAIVAVGGPPGGPGATEIALGLAQASPCRPVVLVDADDVAPSVAQRLGLPLHPNIRTAVDVVEHWSGQLGDALQPVPPAGITVLCGLPSGSDWAELRPGEVVDVLDELARAHATVVVNVGHRVEELGGLTGGSGRYGTTRAVLAHADRLVGVSAPTPVGIARFLDWVADVRALTRAPLHTVVDRAPSAAFQRGELAQELGRTFTPASLTFVPFDKRVVDAAWRGEVVRSGPFTKALHRLAGEVLGAATGTEVRA